MLLPTPVVIGRDAKPPTSFLYKGTLDLTTCDPCPELDPATNGMDFWESLENMRVIVKVLHSCSLQHMPFLAPSCCGPFCDAAKQLHWQSLHVSLLWRVQDPLVVAGTSKYNDFIVVPNKGADSKDSLNAQRGVTANPATGDWNPERLKASIPMLCFASCVHAVLSLMCICCCRQMGALEPTATTSKSHSMSHELRRLSVLAYSHADSFFAVCRLRHSQAHRHSTWGTNSAHWRGFLCMTLECSLCAARLAP